MTSLAPRTSGRSSAWLLIPTAIAIVIVLFWRGSLTDQDPRTESEQASKTGADSQLPKYALVQGADTEFERVPSGTPTPDERASRSETPSAPSNVGTLEVALIDGRDAISEGKVELKPEHGGRTQERAIDPQKRTATFEGLTLEPWRVEGLADLPPGLLPPRLLRPGSTPEALALSVKGGSNRLEISLERGVRVFGYVRGPDGELLDSYVRLCTVNDDWNQSAESKDFPVKNGYYEADYYAGVCDASLLVVPTNPAGVRATYPDPRLLLLPPGSSTQIDFSVKFVDGRIEGRVVDEKGVPMERLKLYLYRHVPLQDPARGRTRDMSECVANATTDVEGGFAFRSLAPGRYSIDASSGNYQPLAKPGGSRLGVMYPGKEVELGDSLLARTELSVVRSHPCRVHGNLVIDPEWNRTRPDQDVGPSILLLTQYPRPDRKDTETDIRAWGGKFDFYVDAATPDPRLRAWIGETSVVYPLALVPDADLPLVLRFPR